MKIFLMKNVLIKINKIFGMWIQEQGGDVN